MTKVVPPIVTFWAYRSELWVHLRPKVDRACHGSPPKRNAKRDAQVVGPNCDVFWGGGVHHNHFLDESRVVWGSPERITATSADNAVAAETIGFKGVLALVAMVASP